MTQKESTYTAASQKLSKRKVCNHSSPGQLLLNRFSILSILFR